MLTKREGIFCNGSDEVGCSVCGVSAVDDKKVISYYKEEAYRGQWIARWWYGEGRLKTISYFQIKLSIAILEYNLEKNLFNII